MPSEAARTAPTRRDPHLRLASERGRMGWQLASARSRRALVGFDVSRWKRVTGGGLCCRTDGRQVTDVPIAARVPNRTLGLGRLDDVCIA